MGNAGSMKRARIAASLACALSVFAALPALAISPAYKIELYHTNPGNQRTYKITALTSLTNLRFRNGATTVFNSSMTNGQVIGPTTYAYTSQSFFIDQVTGTGTGYQTITKNSAAVSAASSTDILYYTPSSTIDFSGSTSALGTSATDAMAWVIWLIIQVLGAVMLVGGVLYGLKRVAQHFGIYNAKLPVSEGRAPLLSSRPDNNDVFLAGERKAEHEVKVSREAREAWKDYMPHDGYIDDPDWHDYIQTEHGSGVLEARRHAYYSRVKYAGPIKQLRGENFNDRKVIGARVNGQVSAGDATYGGMDAWLDPEMKKKRRKRVVKRILKNGRDVFGEPLTQSRRKLYEDELMD